MGDTDPEYEVYQIGAPGHRIVLAPHPDADKNLIRPAERTDEHADK